MSTNGNGDGKVLRFAALVRVSTEKQEKQGESLHTQQSQNERDVERLGGSIVGWYGGQEHATPGWEKEEVDRLIADAAKGMFDAVIVAYPDRWSRDNAKSKEGLEAFRRHGIKFFVGATDMNLWDPNHRLMLGMSAEIGEFMALQTSKKSLENRIERAKKGQPTCGRLPFGRTYDKKAQRWGIDAKDQDIIADIARRYLDGESLVNLCREYRQNHSNICEVLRDRSGDVWQQEFASKSLNMHEVVPTAVPRLLPEDIIKAVRERMESRRTHQHGAPTHSYALNGFVFCGVCGYNLTGQPERNGSPRLYYRHRKHETCTLHPKPWVPAATLERDVLRELFTLFGNPAAIERAVKAAVPDCDALLKRQRRLRDDMSKIDKGRSNVLALVTKGLVAMVDAEKQLKELKEREAAIRTELDRIESQIIHIPTDGKGFIERFENGDGVPDSICVFNGSGDRVVGGNDIASWLSLYAAGDRTEEQKQQAQRDRRALIEAVFGKRLPDGKPAGVYITPTGGRIKRTKLYSYEIRGNLAFTVKPFAQR
jgi:DNA invertase Pin-like site-specific DNA recombinase